MSREYVPKVVPAECMVYFTPDCSISRWTSAIWAETEAEAVSYLVCARRNLSVASEQYLSKLIGDADLRQVSLYAIFDAANRVEVRVA